MCCKPRAERWGRTIRTIRSSSHSRPRAVVGLRKALGATRLDTLVQFLTEAPVMCMLGGPVGVALGRSVAGVAHVVLPRSIQSRPCGMNSRVKTSTGRDSVMR